MQAAMTEAELERYVGLLQKPRWNPDDSNVAYVLMAVLMARLLARFERGFTTGRIAGELHECVQRLAGEFAVQRDDEVWEEELDMVLTTNDPSIASDEMVLAWLDNTINVAMDLPAEPHTTLADMLIRAMLWKHDQDLDPFTQADHSASIVLTKLCLERMSGNISSEDRSRNDGENQLVESEIRDLARLALILVKQAGLMDRYREQYPSVQEVNVGLLRAFQNWRRHHAE